MSGAAVVDAEALAKWYGDRQVLQDVSLRIEPGDVVGLLGPNGAGKTTTVRILTGLVRPSGGRATLFGLPVGDPAARRRLGYLPELFRFPDWMTGKAVVRLHAELAGVPAARRSARVEEALDRVGLGARGADRVRGYSKGMSQRLGLAQALVAAPELLLLDEPTSALDPVGRRDVRDILEQLRGQGVAVLLNSHLLSEVERLCDRVIVIDRGKVRFTGTLAEMTEMGVELMIEASRPDEALTQALLDYGLPKPLPGGTIRLHLTPPWDDDPTAIETVAALVATGPWGLRGLRHDHASVEDAFVRLIQQERPMTVQQERPMTVHRGER